MFVFCREDSAFTSLFSVQREVNMAHSAGAGAQLPLFAVFNINITLFSKPSKVNFHLFHDIYFMWKSPTAHVPSWIFSKPYFRSDSSTQLWVGKSIQTQTCRGGKLVPRSSVSVPSVAQRCSQPVLLDYQCSGVTGLAGQDKNRPWWSEPWGRSEGCTQLMGETHSLWEVRTEQCRIDPSDPAHCLNSSTANTRH